MKIIFNFRLPALAIAALASLPAASHAYAQTAPLDQSKFAESKTDRLFRELLLGENPDAVEWSPDGRRLTFISPGLSPEVFSINTATGEKSRLLSAAQIATCFRFNSKTIRNRNDKPRQFTYKWDPLNRGLLLITEHSLTWFDLQNNLLSPITESDPEISDPQFSPNGKHISFIRDHTLFVVDLTDKKIRQLSARGSENVLEGELDWAYRQAFPSRTAYWWAPDSSAIAYLETDRRQVHPYELPPADDAADAQRRTIRFPLPGQAIPLARPFLVNITTKPSHPVSLSNNSEGYIPVLHWLPSSRVLVWEHLNRSQTKLDLLSLNLSTHKLTNLLSEDDKYWINVADHFLPLPDADRFLWTSERSGFRHLYLYGANGQMLTQLTHGDWEVTDINGVDEKAGQVYFTATEKSPRERHLYRIGLDGAGLTRLTQQPGTHHVEMSPRLELYLDRHSTASSPSSLTICRTADGTNISTVYENPVWPQLQSIASPVELFSMNTHTGVPLDAMMIKPPDFQAGRKYPVIVHLFSGPGTQAANDQWDGAASVWHQMMARRGYIVFAIDPRGAGGHGHLFEEPLHYRLSAQEMGDQRDALTYLRSLPFVDTTRLGVWGSGYGGFLALHAMMDRPVGYKAGFAVSPIAEWDDYNALYSERYLDTPQRNQNGYESSSPLDGLRRFQGPLLIAQGLRDEEIHPSQTYRVLNKLIGLGSNAELALFPASGRLTENPNDILVLFTTATEFFSRNL